MRHEGEPRRTDSVPTGIDLVEQAAHERIGSVVAELYDVADYGRDERERRPRRGRKRHRERDGENGKYEAAEQAGGVARRLHFETHPTKNPIALLQGRA